MTPAATTISPHTLTGAGTVRQRPTMRTSPPRATVLSTTASSPIAAETRAIASLGVPQTAEPGAAILPELVGSSGDHGTARIATIPPLSERLAYPKPPAAELVDDGHGGKLATERRFNAAIARDGTATITNTVAYDWTEKMMLRHGDDARSREKVQFLDRTRDERVGMAQKYRDDQLAHSSDLANESVQALWMRRDLTIAQKREDLFELWDDCAESTDHNDDGMPMNPRAAAGEQVRAQILAFIREHLATGSLSAYSSVEIANLNKHRHSHHVFAPYLPK